MERYLVTHDYGMGALYWWIEAPSKDAILRRYAEVSVVELARVDLNSYHDIPTLRIGDPAPAGLDGLEEKRLKQQGQLGFGSLVGRGVVYVRQNSPEEGDVYFLEYDSEGYRTRQVVMNYSGNFERSTPEDWMFNPPEDLWDPALAACEIDRNVFEEVWKRAAPQKIDQA